MIYWLFTDGHELLGSLLIPLSCLTLLMPLIVSAVFGAGIQRSSEPQSISGWKRGLKLFTHGIVLLGITTIYLSLASNFAIETVRGRQSTNAFIRTSPVARTTSTTCACSASGSCCCLSGS